MSTGTTLICLCITLFCDVTTCWVWDNHFQLHCSFGSVSLNTFSYYAGGGVVPVSMLVASPVDSLCPCELANYAASHTPDTSHLAWIPEFDIRLISIMFHWYTPFQILLISDIPSTCQRWWTSPWAREFHILSNYFWGTLFESGPQKSKSWSIVVVFSSVLMPHFTFRTLNTYTLNSLSGTVFSCRTNGR